MKDTQTPMIAVPFNDRMVYIPQQFTSNDARMPSLIVQIGSGQKHLTFSTLSGYESYTTTYHMEYEIRRQSDYDQSSQLYTAALPHLSDVVFAMPSDTVQADIFNLLINSIPIDLIEFVELETTGNYNKPREIVSFMNCIITNARRYNACWDREARNNVLLVAFRATQWSVRISSVDQGTHPVGTGALDYRFETGAAA